MNILDTQIISYAYKGVYPKQIKHQSIASVTAKEFLLVQGSERTRANYYVPLPKVIKYFGESEMGFPKRDHPFPKRFTDQIILEFGQDYPTIIEFGNLAVSEIINLKARQLFGASLQFLEKQKRKIIMERFDFLIEQDIKCLPLHGNAVKLGLNLFYEFLLHHTPKENIKNTINDVLVLATASNASSTLITQDKLLNRFALEYYNIPLKEDSGYLLIDFGKEQNLERQTSSESKGFINKGWRIRSLNYQGAW